jgi:hypothetical protein
MKKFTAEKERILLDENEHGVNRAWALLAMRIDGVVRHEALILSWLDSPDVDLRGEALNTLAKWKGDEYYSLALERALHDPDEWGRKYAANALCRIAIELPRYEDEVLRLLVRMVESDELFVAFCAHNYAREILGFERQIISRIFDREKDVDWQLLAPYRSN